MNLKNAKGKILIISIVSLLLLNSLVTVGFSNETKDTKEKISGLNISKKVSINNLRVSAKSLTKSAIISNKDNLNTQTDTLYIDPENIVITNETDNESYPSIIRSGLKLLTAYEKESENKTHIYLRNSDDYGRTWSSSKRIEVDLDSYNDIETKSPSFSLKPNTNEAYGAFISPHNNSGVYGYIEISNIGNINSGINAGGVDWSYWINQSSGETFSWYDFSNPDIVCLNNLEIDWVLGFIGSTNYSENNVTPVDNSLMFGWRDSIKPNDYWIQWDPEVSNCSNLVMDIDYNTNTIYGVCQIKNGTSQDILFIKAKYDLDNDLNPYINTTYHQFSGPENLTNPQIYVSGNNIYFSVELHLGEPGETDDVIIYHSSNGGDSWEIIDPTGMDFHPPGEFIPRNPLVYANGINIYCVYTEDCNLYFVHSNNSGANWTDPVKLNSVNDSVVSSYRFSDMSDENHIVWTDNREGKYDIYCVVSGFPEIDLSVVSESVSLSTEGFKLIPTKNRVLFDVRNNGEIQIEDVQVEVSIEFNESLNKTALFIGFPQTISTLKSGDEASFDKTLFRIDLREFIRALIDFAGIKYINITVDPEHKYDDINPIDNTFKLPVSYKDIFSILANLEKIFLSLS